MKNREAGVVIEDCSCSAIDLYQSVFEHDWDNGMEYQITNEYTSKDKAFITDSAQMAVTMPPPADIPGAYVTQLKKYSDVEVVSGYTSPDNALDTVMASLDKVQSSLQVSYTYMWSNYTPLLSMCICLSLTHSLSLSLYFHYSNSKPHTG